LNAKFGNLTPAEIITITERTTPLIKLPNSSTINESLKLIQGVIAVSIKKGYNIGGTRVDQDSDFLMCVELFRDAIDTAPDESYATQLSGIIPWNELTCGTFNLDITTNDQAKSFLALAKNYGLESEHEISKLVSTDPNFHRELNKSLAKAVMDTPLYKAGVTYLVLVSERDVPGCYGGLLFLLSFAFSRSSNFRSQSWGRRFTEVQRQLLPGNTFLHSLSEGSARELSSFIDTKVRDGLDPDILSKEIQYIVTQSFSHIPQLVAVSTQVEFKGLTPIQIIGRAMGERSEIPWDSLFDKFPALREELKTTSDYIASIGEDKYAGVKYGGVAQEIKNLLYFCVRALIILGGEESLRNYAGFGGDGSQSAVPMKVTLDAVIERLKERQVKDLCSMYCIYLYDC
jgi:hypothetical protein